MSSRKGNKRTHNDETVNQTKQIKLDPNIISFKDAENRITNWIFKARVTNKSEIKTYSNGNLFTFDLLDSSGEIHCIVFHPWVETFFDKVIVNNVYLFTNVLLKITNKNFNRCDNLFELILYESSTITECNDEINEVPLYQYNFKSLMNISDCKKNDIIDVIGIISNIGSVEEIVSNKGVKFIKREVELSGEFENKITLVFWRTAAVNFSKQINSILLVKGGKINEYNNDIKLSILNTTIIKVDVYDLPEGKRLQEYVNGKKEV